MPDDQSGLTDEFQVMLNPPADFGMVDSPQLPALPARPSTGATRDEWVAYVVALGADVTFVTEETEHYEERREVTLTAPALDVESLIRLADHLGG